MTPGEPALIQPVSASDADVPGYVLEFERAAAYLPEDQRALLRRAWAVGSAAQAGQSGRSGDPSRTRPEGAAQGPAERKVDVATMVAAVLPESLADTPRTRVRLAQGFGETVAELVDGVTQLN